MMLKTFIFSALVAIALSQSCRFDQVSFKDTCFNTCPPGTVYTMSKGQNICQQCDITKFFILSQDQTKCQCALNTYYSRQQDLCIPCHYSCLTCNGQSSSQCLICDTNIPTTFRVRVGRFCVCPSGYLDNAQLQQTKCETCHPDCKNCTGPLQTDCIACTRQRIKNQFNQCICDKGFVEDDLGNCICPSPLVTFSDGTCKDPISMCGLNQQITGKTINPRSISQAVKRKDKQCACRSGLIKIKGRCKTCKQNQVYNPIKGKCQCDPQANFYKGSCVICPLNQKFKKKTGQCICKKNSQKTQTGECITCPSRTTYLGNGVCGCIFNYYPGRNGKCRKCTKKVDHPNCLQSLDNIDKPRSLGRNQIR